MASSISADVYFQDTFNPANEGEKYFYEGELGGVRYQYQEGGGYVIDATRGSEPGHSVLLHNLSIYRLEVEGRISSQTSPRAINGNLTRAGFGITFNYQEKGVEESYLLFLVNPAEKLFSLERRTPAGDGVVYSAQKNDAIVSGENVLSVEVNDGVVKLGVNGIQVGEYYESEVTEGGFGLYVTAGYRAEFRSFTVFTDATPKAVIHDDFAGTPQRWFAGYQDGVHYKYVDGAYLIDTRGTEKSGVSLFPGYYSSFELEVDVTKLDGEDNYGYGLFFQDVPNVSGGFDQYRFLVSNDGWFTIQRSYEDIPRAIYEWARTDKVTPSVANRLRVRLVDSTLRFYINAEKVYEITGIEEMEGKLGLYVSSGLLVRYDDFRLFQY